MITFSHGQADLLARFVSALETLAIRSHECLATKQDLLAMERRIMSAISDFSAKVNTAFDEISTAVDGVALDVQFLKDQIAALQNSNGEISAEDQVLLDSIDAKASELSTKLKALDAATEEPPAP